MKTKRFLGILFFVMGLPAADNAHRFVGAGETDQPFTSMRQFRQGEILNFPRPYVDGTAVNYQADVRNRWPDGSVRDALISYRTTLPTGTMVVDYRNSTAPCTGGSDIAACRALGLTTAQALTYNSSGWDARTKVKPYPQGANSEQTISARAMLTDGRCRAVLQGPIVTEYVCEGAMTAGGGFYDGNDFQASDTYAVGWKRKYVHRGNGAFLANSATAVTLVSAAGLEGINTPFNMTWFGNESIEDVIVCYVDAAANIIYFGNSAGTSSSCQNINGRPNATGNRTAAWFFLKDAATATGDHDHLVSTINTSSTTGLAVGDLVYAFYERLRISAISNSTSFEVADPSSAAPNVYGRSFAWSGNSRNGSKAIPGGIPLYLVAKADTWIAAPSDRYKSVSPEFHLRFYAGQAGVGVKFFLRNWFYNKFQDQLIDYTFETCTAAGASCTTQETGEKITIVPRQGLKFPRTKTAMRRAWTANAPTYNTDPDPNFFYMYSAGTVSMDPNIFPPSTYINAAINMFPNGNLNQEGWDHADNTRCAPLSLTNGKRYQYHAQMGIWQVLLHLSAARPDIGGPHPLWYTMPLYAVRPGTAVSTTDQGRIWDIFHGQAACSEYFAYHEREGNDGGTAKWCDGAASVKDTAKACPSFTSMLAGGLPINRIGRAVDGGAVRTLAYEELRAIGPWTHGGAVPGIADVVSHMGDLTFLPYYLTGDWEYYQLHMYSSALAHMNSTYGTGQATYSDVPNRLRADAGQWNVLYSCNGVRCLSKTLGWILRNERMTIDATPEKEYWSHHTNLLRTIEEGRFNITTGPWYHACPDPYAPYDSYWCFGRTYKAIESPNGDAVAYPWIEVQGGSPVEAEQTLTRYTNAPWMQFYGAAEIAQAIRMGRSDWLPIYEMWTRGARKSITSPLVPSRFLEGTYRQPIVPCMPEGTVFDFGCGGPDPIVNQVISIGGQVGFTSIANYGAAHDPANRGKRDFGEFGSYGGYEWIAQAGLFLAPLFGTEGRDAWRLYSTIPHTDAVRNPGMFSAEYPAQIEFRATAVGTTTATLLLKIDMPLKKGPQLCSYTLGVGSLPASTLTTGWTNLDYIAGHKVISVTGLTTGTTYYPVVDCAYRRETGIPFTTN